MNLSDEKKAPLQKRTLEQKRIMLAMQYKGSIQVNYTLNLPFTPNSSVDFVK